MARWNNPRASGETMRKIWLDAPGRRSEQRHAVRISAEGRDVRATQRSAAI